MEKQVLSGRSNAIGADTSFHEYETQFVEVCEGLIHSVKYVCVMLKASCIICKVKKDSETPDHFVWNEPDYGRKINL